MSPPPARPRRPLVALAGVLAATAALAAPAAAIPTGDGQSPVPTDPPLNAPGGIARSANLYRLPYTDGTPVRVSRDHLNHQPPGRLDLSGTGSDGPFLEVAAAAGTIRFIVDGHTAEGGACADNNYVWIEHANGEWTKYSHMRPGSVTGTARLKVGDRVAAGRFLGYEDDIGCASGEHLHFEVAVPDDPADPIHPSGGYIKGRNRVPRICRVSGGTLVAGRTYTAGPCTTPATTTTRRPGTPPTHTP